MSTLTADMLYSRRAIARHMLILDMALGSLKKSYTPREIRALAPLESPWVQTRAHRARGDMAAIASRPLCSTFPNGTQ